MKMKNSESSTNSIGSRLSFPFVSLLTLVFVVFKLLGKIDWSWWWVFCPMWLSAAFLIVFLTIVFILVALTDR